jgi:molybdopterin-containing oxidoreductase family iron-sulfur binding subunit
MDASRRGFLKIAGLSLVGAAGGSPLIASTGEPGTWAEGPAADPPRTGPRLAMVIDLRKFRRDDGLVERCIRACHDAHNVPDFGNDRKNEIKWIWTEDFESAFRSEEFRYLRRDLQGKATLLLCNHCDNPPCTKVCPTKATWRRDSDGIVMMDWHRCIGCRYCIVACPYGSRSFNWTDPRPHLASPHADFPTRMRGVVEKCTFCEERLASGGQPACVEACADDEIVFGDVNDPGSKVRRLLADHLAIRRKPGLGTRPEVYYIVEDPRTLVEAVPAAVVSGAAEHDHA